MVGAIRFWKTDPPHRAVLIDPKWTDIGIAVVSPSAFPGDTTGRHTWSTWACANDQKSDLAAAVARLRLSVQKVTPAA
jgi:hypothetical protein